MRLSLPSIGALSSEFIDKDEKQIKTIDIQNAKFRKDNGEK